MMIFMNIDSSHSLLQIGLIASFLLQISHAGANNRGRSFSRGHSTKPLTCPRKNGLFPHSKDCSKFIECSNGAAYLKDCGPGTHFNARISRCDWPYNADCHDNKQPERQSGTKKQRPQSKLKFKDKGKQRDKGKVETKDGTQGWWPLRKGQKKGSQSTLKKNFKKLKTKTDVLHKKVRTNKGKKKQQSSKTSGKNKAEPGTWAQKKVKKGKGIKGQQLSKTPVKYISKTKKNERNRCPKPYGQFAYDKDCSKFVNCWKGRVFLHSCPAGLLFDTSQGECNYPHSVVCPSEYELEEVDKEMVEPPFSGQKIRLHKGPSYFAGYLQIFVNGRWLHVIIKPSEWKLKNEICKQLGHERGALSETRGMHYTELSPEEGFFDAIECSGDEEDVFKCREKSVTFETFSASILGIRCKKNSASECPIGWSNWGEKCYYVEKGEKLSHKDARDQCASMSAILVSVTSQAKNDFLSDLLKYSKDKIGFHTGGKVLGVHGEDLWIWEDSDVPRTKELSYANWWRGWKGENLEDAIRKDDVVGDSIECVSLHKEFYAKKMNSNFSADYYFWKLNSCDVPLHYVCEREKLDIGCMEDRGQTYNGTANITTTGAPCLYWDQMGGIYRGLTDTNIRENFCVNPDNDNRPWCFVAQGKTEYCNIPKCPTSGILLTEVPRCEAGMFSCSTGECIHKEWQCDGKKNCPKGDDESHDRCPDYSDWFSKKSGFKLVGKEVETWLPITKSGCEIRCALAKDFICHSFNYQEATENCILSSSNAGLSGGLIQDLNWQYHERKDLKVDCSHAFNCTDHKCIIDNLICDGHKDCRGGEDEDGCTYLQSFEVRLANGSDLNEGRVEVRVQGEWGRVCDDFWGVEDGHVVCRQLGFKRGAKKITTDSYFGEGEGPYFIDDINCHGTEESLALCDFPGWMQSDCKASESAGVICLMDDEECSEHQWECDDGQCISLTYYCDSLTDCADGSDELPQKCRSPIELRLASSNDSLLRAYEDEVIGRVEVRYKGLWGSICDDDITIKEGHVLCNMLGYKGALGVFKNNTFGPGSGPIWIDGLRCLGVERSIEDCYKQKWGKNNCDHNEDLGVLCTAEILSEQNLSNDSASGFLTAGVNLPLECGIRFVEDNPKEILASPRLVEGLLPKAGAHPWMAGLRKRKSATVSIHRCGAFVISSNLILTAAHCVVSYPASDYLVRTGDFDNEEEDGFEEEWDIEHIFIHEHYNKDIYLNNDLAILKIKRKDGQSIKFNERVQPLCLPPEEWHYPAWQNCTVAGWGTTSSIGRSRLLLSTTLPILPDSTCKSKHVYKPDDISDGMFCAGYLEGGIDTCQGDSGGPLVCPINGQHTAVGIISWGHGCAKANKPGVYTKLSRYVEWIQRKIKILENIE